MDTTIREQIALKMESKLPFETVAQNLQDKAAENSFRVLALHDVQATLAEKGFERGPLKIIEVYNSKFAHQALKMDMDVALFMPCRFTVYEKEGKTMVTLARPTMISEMLPGSGLESMAAEVEEQLTTIMKASL